MPVEQANVSECPDEPLSQVEIKSMILDCLSGIMGTDDQQIGMSLAGTVLTVTLEDGGSASEDLASILPPDCCPNGMSFDVATGILTITQDNGPDITATIPGASYDAATSIITFRDGTALDLSTLGGGTDDQTVTQFGFDVATNTASITVEDDAGGQQTMDLSALDEELSFDFTTGVGVFSDGEGGTATFQTTSDDPANVASVDTANGGTLITCQAIAGCFDFQGPLSGVYDEVAGQVQVSVNDQSGIVDNGNGTSTITTFNGESKADVVCGQQATFSVDGSGVITGVGNDGSSFSITPGAATDMVLSSIVKDDGNQFSWTFGIANGTPISFNAAGCFPTLVDNGNNTSTLTVSNPDGSTSTDVVGAMDILPGTLNEVPDPSDPASHNRIACVVDTTTFPNCLYEVSYATDYEGDQKAIGWNYGTPNPIVKGCVCQDFQTSSFELTDRTKAATSLQTFTGNAVVWQVRDSGGTNVATLPPQAIGAKLTDTVANIQAFGLPAPLDSASLPWTVTQEVTDDCGVVATETYEIASL